MEKTETLVNNQNKMISLIAFCRGQTGLLIEHVQNPKSNKEAVLDDEQKEMLELFDSMMKTFTESKYRGEEARLKAEKILKTIGSLSKSESEIDQTETIKSTKEILFDDTEEILVFEREAKAQVYREALTKLDGELGKFSKTGKDVEKLKSLDSRLNQIKKVLTEVGDESTDGLNLKKVGLKIDELTLRHVNKDVYKNLSDNFPTYERIIMSPEVKKEDKITYVDELLAALEKHRADKTNTMIQNAVLNDTIEKYKKVLTSIK